MKALSAAILSATLALMSAFAFGGVLHRDAARSSRQQPTEERWFEPPTPTSLKLVSLGRTLFLDSCARCHGADARGDEGPDLHNAQVSDRYIAAIITDGIPHEMPAFAKKHGAADITALTAYVRSLESPDSSDWSEKTPNAKAPNSKSQPPALARRLFWYLILGPWHLSERR